MPNLDVVAVLTAKSGSEGIVEAALKDLAAASKNDHGCLAYDLYVSESAPGTFITVEKWASQEDIDAHMAGPHIANVIAVAGDHFEGLPAIHTLRSLG
jgi:quinol monooxygenase YgiN